MTIGATRERRVAITLGAMTRLVRGVAWDGRSWADMRTVIASASSSTSERAPGNPD